MNNAAVNTGIQISVQVPAVSSFGYIPRSGVAESFTASRFEEMFSTAEAPFYTPTAKHEDSNFSISSPTFVNICLLDRAILVGVK